MLAKRAVLPVDRACTHGFATSFAGSCATCNFIHDSILHSNRLVALLFSPAAPPICRPRAPLTRAPHRVSDARYTYPVCSFVRLADDYDQSEVTDQMDLLRAQAKGQELDEAKAQDKIEAQLERDLLR